MGLLLRPRIFVILAAMMWRRPLISLRTMERSSLSSGGVPLFFCVIGTSILFFSLPYIPQRVIINPMRSSDTDQILSVSELAVKRIMKKLEALPMVDQSPQVGSDEIAKLRELTKEFQTIAEFADAVDVGPGRVSEWLAGKTRPSVEAWIKLAAFAVKSHSSTAPFFLQQTGLDLNALMSVLGMLARKGEVKMDETILAAAEDELNKRKLDQGDQAEIDKASGVLVPPFEDQPSAAVNPMLVIPALLVPHKASIRYIVAPNHPLDTARHGCAPGDFVFFDTSVSGSGEILEQLVGEEIVLRLRVSVSAPHQWGELFIGRVGWGHGGRVAKRPEHLALYGSDEHPLAHGLSGYLKLGGSWRKEHGDEPLSSPGIPHENLRDWYEDSECKVLGQFVARFNAGTVGIWKQEAQKEAKHDRIKRNMGLL